MPTSYYLQSTTSDLGGGDDFSRVLGLSTGTLATLVVSVANGVTENSFGYTEAGNPGTTGNTGSYLVRIDVQTGSASIQLSTAVARVNSSGVQQAISSFSTEQAATAGTRIFSHATGALGTWLASDRLRVTYRLRSTQAHGGAAEVTLGFNTANSEVIAPWVWTASNTRTHTTDVAVVAIESLAHSTDLVVVDQPIASHSTDLVAQKTNTVAHSTDVVLFSEGGASHLSSTDFEGTAATSFSHTLDAGTDDDRVLLVAIRHGDSSAGITHTVPSYAGSPMTQIGNIVDAGSDLIRMSLWRHLNPVSGSNTLEGGFSAAVDQYSISAVVAIGEAIVTIVQTGGGGDFYLETYTETY